MRQPHLYPRLSTAPVSIEGGLKDDSTGLHCFLLIRRRGSSAMFWNDMLFLSQWGRIVFGFADSNS